MVLDAIVARPVHGHGKLPKFSEDFDGRGDEDPFDDVFPVTRFAISNLSLFDDGPDRRCRA
ncbi:hypothetical protein DYI37_12435 [Fulvimarina endophytica]|uniref:Uncharacterized protein n=1 Tax=Fulvimarina endophytica TaxID=2293836 RepID=A0A371X165_9HYPH|nr:hypothetical protein DYI37_12435 [Fulvimarina endophytica]